jgi:DNA adenine methylase
MLVETKGRISPTEIDIQIESGWEVFCQEEAKRRQERDNARADEWGKGLSKEAHMVGLIGECAFAKYMGKHVDFGRNYDNGFDFVCGGLKVDVKSTASQKIPLIKQLEKKKCHRFVMAVVRSGVVSLLGWISWEDVQSKPLVKALKGNHMNHQIEQQDLFPMAEMRRSKPGANLLRYPGGKSKLLRQLERVMPPGGGLFSPERYVEPFLGGGSVAISNLMRTQFKSVLLADKDFSLIALWKCVRDTPLLLVSQVSKWRPNVEDWYKAKDLDGIEGDAVTVAMNKLILQYCSHAGIGYLAGGPQGGKRQDSEYKIGCRWNADRIVRTIQAFSKLLNGVEIVHCDFEQIELRCSDFVFADPPYAIAGESLYRHSFLTHDHMRLKEWITCGGQEWVVTYDDCDLIRDLYSGHTISEIVNATGNNNSKVELIITKDG